jgi:hypothetical protein
VSKVRLDPRWLEPEAILARFQAERRAEHARTLQHERTERDLLEEVATLRHRLDRLESRAAPARRTMRQSVSIRQLPLVIKSVNVERRELEGIASASSTDHVGDEVIATGAVYELPLPLLWTHDARSPVGSVHDVVVSKDALQPCLARSKGAKSALGSRYPGNPG